MNATYEGTFTEMLLILHLLFCMLTPTLFELSIHWINIYIYICMCV